MKDLRNNLSKEFVQLQSKKICEQIYERTKSFDSFLCYLSFKNEVNLEHLITRLLDDKKAVCIPICIDGENMIISQISNMNFEYHKNNYGIIEPTKITEPVNPVQVCIVPGVCFDKNKNRLGYGKGYYDRFFTNNNLYKIGACYDFQLVPEIANTEYDVKMDCIITEKRVF